MSDVRGLIWKYALQNAVKYESDAEVGAVMGKLMGEHPELREQGDELSGTVAEVVSEVNSLSSDERQQRLKEKAPELIKELESESKEENELPALPGADNNVVMRFAPNPNGPPTLGSARGLVVNDEYVKQYGGDLLLRFDDTDPVNKRPIKEAYDWYIEDAEWLGVEVSEVYRASKRLETYYEHSEHLIREGGAYICHCPQQEFQELKKEGRACPHREQPAETNLDGWDKMVDGEYEEGEAVLRVKTNIQHKNPALRDWVAFRIVKTPHPIVGDRYSAWPLLDFQSAIDDHLLDVTHIIRGKDLRDSEDRQRYIYDYLGWTYPETIHWGRISIEEYGTLSTSSLAEALEEGRYAGWDDPGMPTVRALRRRGIQPTAIREALLDLGVSESDISFSMEHVYAENRKLIDPEANRYFFVRNPVEMEILDTEPRTANPPLHPDDMERGKREIEVENTVVVEPSDIPSVGDKIRLKDLYNVEVVSTEPLQATYIGNDISLVRENDIDVIHWMVPTALNATLRTPEGNESGVVERGVRNEEDKVVQFERVGFARIEEIDPVTAFYSHR